MADTEEKAAEPAAEAPAPAPLAEYPPKSKQYLEWIMRKLISKFKVEPKRWRAMKDVMKELEEKAEKRDFKGAVPEADWDKTAECLRDTAFVRAQLKKFMQYGGAEGTDASKKYMAQYEKIMAAPDEGDGADDDSKSASKSKSRSRSRSRGRRRRD
mmetsp:Transcript_27398/g.85221  ORF Transcript_27398/g.85221 Transcript_27398/m.85221 type:complete len:156 (+) Transcript_27398:1232-1699(+)